MTQRTFYMLLQYRLNSMRIQQSVVTEQHILLQDCVCNVLIINQSHYLHVWRVVTMMCAAVVLLIITADETESVPCVVHARIHRSNPTGTIDWCKKLKHKPQH